MCTLAQLNKRRENFEAFLNARGAQILQPTNEWEVLRFRSSAGTSVIYRNAQEGITFTGESAKAWDTFTGNTSWRANVKPKAPKKVDGLIRVLLDRDGNDCFYCFKPMTDLDRSVEHLVARAHGGPNHLSNMVLAHRKCNCSAGHMSAMEKIRIREHRGSSR
jgi:hypothetical protein